MIKSFSKVIILKKLDFKLIKNNNVIINENNINCIENRNKVFFYIEGIKYSYDNNIFTKETKEEIISFNFNTSECKITLKENNLSLILNINILEIKTEEEINIKYNIETEENTTNEIILKIYQ